MADGAGLEEGLDGVGSHGGGVLLSLLGGGAKVGEHDVPGVVHEVGVGEVAHVLARLGARVPRHLHDQEQRHVHVRLAAGYLEGSLTKC